MLRVFLPAPPRADRADRWIRVNADGRIVDRGQDVPSRWPADAAIEAVLAADQVRVIALALPPMPRERLRGAVRYALEDRIATPLDESAIAIAEPRNGTCVVAVASAALIRETTNHERRFARIVSESALAPLADGWTWCASSAGDGFVRRHDGSAFAVQGIDDDGSLPAELAAALAQAKRANDAPASVHAAFAAEPSRLAQWTQASGVPFASAPAWQWDQVNEAAYASAPDFLRDAQRTEGKSASASAWRTFRPALVLAALALAIHLGGLIVQWSWLGVERWRLAGALVDTAKAAQLPDAQSTDAAAQAISRQYSAARHRASQPAPADALPLLARAAPALAELPAGALRSARYAGDAWTVDLVKLDASTLSRLERRLGDAGLDALAAPASGGTRMRLSLAATAR